MRAIFAVVALLSGSPALAQEGPPPTVGASYVMDAFANASGGLDRGATQMGLLDLTAIWSGPLLGIDGVEAYADIQFAHGRSLTGRLVGDAQGASNIDAPDGVRAFEAWMSVPLGGKGYVKGGLIDLNGEFDVQNVGALFINSSHGIGPDFSQSGRNGPSIYPTTSTAVVGGWREAAWSARVGLFDAVSGDPDRPRRTIVRVPGATGLLLVGEADFRIAPSAEIQLGAWTYTSRFETIEANESGQPARRRGNRGAYAMLEGRIAGSEQSPVDAWVRAGLAEDEINPIGLYLGGGVALGPEARRWGIALAHARLGDPALAAAAIRPHRAETNFELTYSHALDDRMVVQPDVQYVVNPGWHPELKDALVIGVRFAIKLF